jgi:hypothetical protein
MKTHFIIKTLNHAVFIYGLLVLMQGYYAIAHAAEQQ